MVGRYIRSATALVVLLVSEVLAPHLAVSDEVLIGSANNRGRVTLAQGQQLVVVLESNPTTGFTWEVVESGSPVLKSQGGPEYRPCTGNGDPAVGAGGEQVFRFSGDLPGERTLRLVYRRPWEKEIPPAKKFCVQVVVR